VARFEPSGSLAEGATRGRELVFIGTGLCAEALKTAVDSCLMKEGETSPPDDPLPSWDIYGLDETCEHEHRKLPRCHGGDDSGPGGGVATAPHNPSRNASPPRQPPCCVSTPGAITMLGISHLDGTIVQVAFRPMAGRARIRIGVGFRP
jgi:hypothetical protein